LTGKKITGDIKIHKDNGTLVTSTEVNTFFSTICKTYPSVSDCEIETLIRDSSEESIVEVTEYSVFKEIEKLKKNCSSYPGEMPVKLLIEYAVFLAKPLTSVINQCFKEQRFPRAWKKAYVRVIPKVKGPKSCDQLRPISITPNLAKVTESFIYHKLLSQISPSWTPFSIVV
jgi:hypothetical protein